MGNDLGGGRGLEEIGNHCLRKTSAENKAHQHTRIKLKRKCKAFLCISSKQLHTNARAHTHTHTLPAL